MLVLHRNERAVELEISRVWVIVRVGKAGLELFRVKVKVTEVKLPKYIFVWHELCSITRVRVQRERFLRHHFIKWSDIRHETLHLVAYSTNSRVVTAKMTVEISETVRRPRFG